MDNFFLFSPLSLYSLLCLTDSQNGWGWRDLWRWSLHLDSPTLLLKQPHLEQFARDHIQTGFHNLSGLPVPELWHPQSKEVFLHVQVELRIFQFVHIAPCPVTGHHWKESGPIFLTSMCSAITRFFWSYIISLWICRIHQGKKHTKKRLFTVSWGLLMQ